MVGPRGGVFSVVHPMFACEWYRTLTLHRKLAVAFRDPQLYRVFELALMANRQLQNQASPEQRLREQVLLCAFRV